jgi:hypothetical protein
MMRFNEYLQSIYATVGNEWVNRNGIVFLSATTEGLAIAGSIAVAIGRKKAIRIPGDIDLVCAEVKQAKAFIARLEDKLMQSSVYWKVQTNNRTAFCPDGCTTHFRITAPFWLPICVMVIGEVKMWRTQGGNPVQQFEDVVRAAEALDERDGRDRLTEEEPRDPLKGSKWDLDVDFSATESSLPLTPYSQP